MSKKVISYFHTKHPNKKAGENIIKHEHSMLIKELNYISELYLVYVQYCKDTYTKLRIRSAITCSASYHYEVEPVSRDR